MRRQDIKKFLGREIRKEFPQMSETSISKLASDLEPIISKYSSIPPTESASILGLGIRLLTDQIAEKHKVSKDKVSSIAVEALKRFAFKMEKSNFERV